MDNLLTYIFFCDKYYISIKISLGKSPIVQLTNNPALVHLMAWRRTVDKTESMMAWFINTFMRH